MIVRMSDDLHSIDLPAEEGPAPSTSSGSIVPEEAPYGQVTRPSVIVIDDTEDEIIVINTEDLGTSDEVLVINPIDLVIQITILQPEDQCFTFSQSVNVSGNAEPLDRLRATCGAHVSEVEVSVDGTFIFHEVPIEFQWNEIILHSVKYPEMYPVSVQVYRRERRWPFLGHTDPYTRAQFQPADIVVRCQHCKAYNLMESWQAGGGCGRCHSHQHWTPSEPAFSLDEGVIEI